jgi:hypothetical protein
MLLCLAKHTSHIISTRLQSVYRIALASICIKAQAGKYHWLLSGRHFLGSGALPHFYIKSVVL